MSIITVGIDLAKNVFAVHGVDDNGKPVIVESKVAHQRKRTNGVMPTWSGLAFCAPCHDLHGQGLPGMPPLPAPFHAVRRAG